MIYRPRAQFVPFHTRHQRWAVLVCHRRAGKTVAAINDLVGRAQNTAKAIPGMHPPQYAYIAPFHSQAKRVAFDYLLRYTSQPGQRVDQNLTELSVTLNNGAKISLYGADNPDALRGIYLDGVVIDEPAGMRSRVYTEVVRPLLADRQGWCVFIGTPAGKNEFWRIAMEAKNNPQSWFFMVLKASESGLLAQPELDDARKIMSEDEYEQEFECSFEAAIKGSFYGKLINAMGERLGKVPYDNALPVHISMDLGFTDTTAVWMWQTLGNEIRYIRAFEDSGLAISDYVDRLRDYPYVYGDIWVPPDAKARSLQTGLSVVQILHKQHGIKPKLVPNALSVQQGIQAARLMLQSCWIDADNCAEAVESLKTYQRMWDDELKTFKQTPKHDKHSNYADSFRYSSIVATRGGRDIANRITSVSTKPNYDPTKPFGGNIRLNDLWGTAARRDTERI